MNKKIALIVALAVVGTFAALVIFNDDVAESSLSILRVRASKNLTGEFAKWKATYNKTYGGVEHDKRYKIFSDNYRVIERTNAANKSYKLAVNHFADLTRTEFSSLYLGLKKRTNSTKRHLEGFEDAVIEDIKVGDGSVDWRTKGAVNKVKNQGQCGSCWAFSTTGTLEGVAKIAKGKLWNFSEQQLVDCAGGVYGNEGCNGGLMTSALEYTAKYGIEQESDYGYKGVDGKCKYDASKVVFKNSGQKAANSDSALQAAVEKGPVAVSVEADRSAFQFYKSGIVDGSACGTELDHGVLAVGYGSTGGKGYWIVKNSWGPSWGDQGYLKISRTSGKGTCGINQDNVIAIA